jgi:hypothetical protein
LVHRTKKIIGLNRQVRGSSTFVEIFVAPEPKRRNSLLLHIVKTSIEDSFKNSGLATNFDSLKPDEFITSNQLDPSKLSVNHAKLPEEIQKVEKLTRLRRAEPL